MCMRCSCSFLKQKTGNAIRALGRMAMLSANSRRSPTTTAESSPTLEAQRLDVEKLSLDDTIESLDIDNDTEPVGTESSGMEKNIGIQETSTSDIERKHTFEACQKTTIAFLNDSTRTFNFEKEFDNVNSNMSEMSSTKEEENSTNSFSKRTNAKAEASESDSGLIWKTITVHPSNKGSDKKLMEKRSEAEQNATLRSQMSRRMLRGDSRDSGIGDCNSSQFLTCPLQVDELGVVSTIKEETDHETCGREGKRFLRWDEMLKNQQSSTSKNPMKLVRDKENSFDNKEDSECGDKVATKSDVTKASCKINLERKGLCNFAATGETTDARLLIGRNRDKFLQTGNVSRTARIFEREGATAEDSQVSPVQRAYPAAIVPGKPYNERIQKAFAFWNK